MITKLVIENFKQFEREEIELGSNIVLAGHNNSGKTSILQAISAWQFLLHEWLEYRQKEKSVGIIRREFAAVPLHEFNQLWRNKSSHFKKDEMPGKKPGSNRPLRIELHGRYQGEDWKYGIELIYANRDQIRVRPAAMFEDIPEGAKNLEVAYIPSFSGISVQEIEVTKKYQDTLIGQGKPGDILRNMLQEVGNNEKNWKELSEHVERIFGHKLLKPSRPGEKSYIDCQYIPNISPRDVTLDINTTGSGFQQTLLLLAFIYARPASILLVDEPDAHLHVNLQTEILRLLESILKERNGQLIIATHSEVIIDSTDPAYIISMFGKNPHRLSDTHDVKKLNEAMKRLTATDIMKCEQSNGMVLCVEGQSDFDILRAWSNILKHPLSAWFNRKEFYWYSMQGKRLTEARDHFAALQAVNPDMKCFVLTDSDGQAEKSGGIDQNMKNILLRQWNRYEIENYLVHPDAIQRLEDQVRGNIYKTNLELDIGAAGRLKDIMPPDYFNDPLEDSTGYLKAVKSSEVILPFVFKDAGMEISKNEYYRLAEVMKPEEIHSDVKDMLDAIWLHFNLEGKMTE